MALYQSSQLWTGRNDGSNADVARWHQVINILDLNENILKSKDLQVALLGFCCDEGVRRNKGRQGAKKGPLHIRQACSNFAVHFNQLELYDAGDIICNDDDLEAAQIMLGEKVDLLIRHNYFPIVLGGGHEVAYGNFLGIKEKLSKGNSFGAINFDAHFDLRSVEDTIGATSGTGFWQMAKHIKNVQNEFHYLAIGVQQCSNTKRLYEIADEWGVVYIHADEFTNDQLEHMLNVINGIMSNSNQMQLSIDMDVFAAAHAPGVSAPAFNGIAPNSMFKRLLRHIIFSGKIASVDIAEVNPTYDIDNRTSRLAASIIYDIVHAVDRNLEWE